MPGGGGWAECHRSSEAEGHRPSSAACPAGAERPQGATGPPFPPWKLFDWQQVLHTWDLVCVSRQAEY